MATLSYSVREPALRSPVEEWQPHAKQSESVSNNLIKKNAGGILLTDENNSNHDNLVDGNDVEDNIPDCGVAQRDERPAYELLHDHTHQVRRHHQPHLRRRGKRRHDHHQRCRGLRFGDRSVRSVLYVRGDPRARNDAVHAKIFARLKAAPAQRTHAISFDPDRHLSLPYFRK